LVVPSLSLSLFLFIRQCYGRFQLLLTTAHTNNPDSNFPFTSTSFLFLWNKINIRNIVRSYSSSAVEFDGEYDYLFEKSPAVDKVVTFAQPHLQIVFGK
jgi:hypothetical protein